MAPSGASRWPSNSGNDGISDEQAARLRERARFVRLETIRLISIAKVGHYSSVFSCAEIFSTLYYDTMRLRRGEPGWPDRDRFLMGKGHAAVGQFPILADLDFFDLAIPCVRVELKTECVSLLNGGNCDALDIALSP